MKGLNMTVIHELNKITTTRQIGLTTSNAYTSFEEARCLQIVNLLMFFV